MNWETWGPPIVVMALGVIVGVVVALRMTRTKPSGPAGWDGIGYRHAERGSRHLRNTPMVRLGSTPGTRPDALSEGVAMLGQSAHNA